MTSPSNKNGPGLLAAMHSAQLLAFGPLLFQAARVLRDRGLLRVLIQRAPQGLTKAELAAETKTSAYGVTVLLEAGMALGLVRQEEDVFRATRVGYLVEKDPMTRVNMNFVHDVCYRAAAHMDEAIETGTPAGLSELGDWSTVYEGLSKLSEPARQSWLDFDHFYSDDAFPLVLSRVLESKPRRLLDVGGNTGKFATQVLRASEDVGVTVADLPGQIGLCRQALEAAGLSDRAGYYEFSILEPDAQLPQGHDVIWMSQFLSCFGEDDVVHALRVAREAMSEGTRLLIMDNLWDRQKNQVGELCLQATSLYFTCVANGQSRMYDGATMLRMIHDAGLVVERQTDGIGWGHSLIECRTARAR